MGHVLNFDGYSVELSLSEANAPLEVPIPGRHSTPLSTDVTSDRAKDFDTY